MLKSYSKQDLYMNLMKTIQKIPCTCFAENEPVMIRNDAVLNYLHDELWTMKTDDKIRDNCKYPLATNQAAQNKKQTNTGGLAKLLYFAKLLQKWYEQLI